MEWGGGHTFFFCGHIFRKLGAGPVVCLPPNFSILFIFFMNVSIPDDSALKNITFAKCPMHLQQFKGFKFQKVFQGKHVPEPPKLTH